MRAVKLGCLFAVPMMLLGAMSAQSEDYFKDKTVTVMVPSGLGASMGLYGRVVADALKRTIPGHPTVIVVSRPGAGGTKGASYAYNAGPTDGSYIAMISSGNVLIQVMRPMKFDVRKFQWLGTVTPRSSVIWVWHTSPIKTLEDAKKMPAILGSTGKGSGMSIWPTITNSLVGTRFKVVEGYKGGSAVNKAAEQGELNGRWTSYSGLTAGNQQWLQTGKIRVIAQFGPKIADQPQAPRIADLVTGDDRKIVEFIELSERVGLGHWVRPEVPKERVAILRKAFAQAMKDPEVIADGQRRGAPIDFVSGEELDRYVAEAYSRLTDPLRLRLRKLLGIKG